MIEIFRNILKYTGIFRMAKVKDKEDQKEYTKVVIIVVSIIAALLFIKFLIV